MASPVYGRENCVDDALPRSSVHGRCKIPYLPDTRFKFVTHRVGNDFSDRCTVKQTECLCFVCETSLMYQHFPELRPYLRDSSALS